MSEETNKHENETEVETEMEKQTRFTRNCRDFIDYINYDWEADEEWTTFEHNEMKDANLNSPKQKEEIKREYFKMNVN